MIKAEWTKADALDLQPTCNQLATDCISRLAAIEAIKNCTDIYVTNLPVMIDKADAHKALSQLPPVQPEVVRCKDCAKRKYCRTSTVWTVPPNDDWYCADAKPYEGGRG